MSDGAAPLVSVIVPVFNTAPYLARCLRSLVDSTLREIEIICVDDASTDGSAAIVEEFARRDSRIRLIRHDRNRGLGGARNTGIAAARAAYVGGVDSDDWIAPAMYERLLAATEGGRVDVVEGGYLQIDEAGEVVRTYRPAERTVENNGHQVNIFEVTRPSFCTKLIRRALFTDHGIWFPEKTFYEDLATMPRLLAMSRVIRFVEDTSYFYFRRDGSITFSASEKHQMDHFKVFDILLDFLYDNGLVARYGRQFALQVGNRLMFHATNVAGLDVPEPQKAQYLRHMLMMMQGYQMSFAELHGASCEDLVPKFRRNLALERVKEVRALTEGSAALAAEVSRLNEREAALEAEISLLTDRAAALDAQIAVDGRRYQELVTDPLWKLTAPARRLRSSAVRAAGRMRRSAPR